MPELGVPNQINPAPLPLLRKLMRQLKQQNNPPIDRVFEFNQSTKFILTKGGRLF